jgi:PAS domain S-box-containing protein
MNSAARNEPARSVDLSDKREGQVISVVDDDESIRDSLRQLLRSAGYQVVAFDSAESFLKSKIEKSKCIILDVKMPGIGGLELQSRLNESGADIPIVFVTAHDNSGNRKKAIAAGAAGFLSKPLETRMLLATIEMALGRQSQDHGRTPTSEISPSLEDAGHTPAEQQWRTDLFNSLEDGVIVTDLSGRVVLLNPAAENITGWTRAEACGTSIEKLFSFQTPSGSPVGERRLHRELGGETTKGRYLVKAKRGLFPVERTISAIRRDGQVIGLATIVRDLTVRPREETIQEDNGHSAERVPDAALALEATRSELQRLSEHLVTAQEDERRRLSREIHDDLGQRVSLMGMSLDELAKTAPTGIRDALLELRNQISEFSTTLRNMSHQLHPSLLADLGLSVALDRLAQDYRKAGIEINISANPATASLPLTTATALYRITQEALSNVVKHAHGSRVQITLMTFESELRLIIQDSGPGFSLGDVRSTGGLGLLSMQERARIAGGSLLLSTKPGAGTLVLVRVPISGDLDEQPGPHPGSGGSSSDT